MRPVTTRTILLALLALTALDARAVCLPERPVDYLVRIRVEKCQSIEDFASEAVEQSRFRWMQRGAANVAFKNPGVVIQGTAIESIGITREEDRQYTAGAFEHRDEEGSWHFSGTAVSCDAFPASSETVLFEHLPCCDVYPPGDVLCYFSLRGAREVPASLVDVLPAK